MPMKTTGAELRAFYNDDTYWQVSNDGNGADIWCDELVLEVNGVEAPDSFSINEDLKDEDQVTITYGYVMSSNVDFTDRSFESFFKAWRKKQDTVLLSVSVSKENVEAVRAAILAAGGIIK